MRSASIPPQDESTEGQMVGAHDGDFPSVYGHGIYHPEPSSLASYSTYHPSRDASTLTSDGIEQTSGVGIRPGVDQIYSPQPLDTFTQLEISPFRNNYAPDNNHTQQHFEDNGMQIGLMGQYHPNSVSTSNYLGHTDPHYAPYPTPIAPATSFQAEMEFLSSAQALPSPVIPSQGSPLSLLESSAQASLLAATLAMANMDGTPEYRHGPTSQPHPNPGHHGTTLFSAQLPYPDPDAIGQEMRRMGSHGHITLNHESGSRDQFFPNASSGNGGPRFASPDLMDTERQDHLSSVPILVDGHHNYIPHRYATLQNGAESFASHIPTRAYTDPIPGYVPGSTSQPYANSNGMILVEILYPNTPSQFYGNIAHDQAPSATMPTTADSNIMMSSFAPYSEEHDPLQQTATWDDIVQPSMSTLPNQMDTVPSYGQFFDQTFSPSTRTSCQSESISSPGPNATWSSPYSTRELPHRGLPNHRTPRQETFNSISVDSDLADDFPCSPDTTDEGDFVASPPALADEEQEYSSLTPATHSWARLNAEERLKRALGQSSPLKEVALIKLLRLIVELPCILTHQFEPTISSGEGRALINQIRNLPDCPSLPLDTSDDSIFTLFVAYPEFRCLICGKKKQSMVRGIGCVRKHLEHRPYPCFGDGGCKSCPGKGSVERFCSASSLYDHRKKQGKWVECTSCGIYLKGNLGRHQERCRVNAPFRHAKSQKGA